MAALAQHVARNMGRGFAQAIGLILLPLLGAQQAGATPAGTPPTATNLSNQRTMVPVGSAEQFTSFTLASGVRVHITLPRPLDTTTRPLHLILYALPNGNSIEETAGSRDTSGTRWRYGIQHIAAQTRWLNQHTPNAQYAVAYLQAENKSWPTWRKQQGDTGATRCLEVVDAVLDAMRPATPQALHAVAHSGGGSLLFGMAEATTTSPLGTMVSGLERFQTMAFLDANYNFRPAPSHPAIFAQWLKGAPQRSLISVAYDDRSIVLDGKPVVGPDGGTWRATQRMISGLQTAGIPITTADDGQTTIATGLQGRVDLRIVANPQNKILHTVLVERNGLVHALSPDRTTTTPLMSAPVYKSMID